MIAPCGWYNALSNQEGFPAISLWAFLLVVPDLVNGFGVDTGHEELNMPQQCELLEKCGFFLNFKGNPEAITESWIRLYCESLEKSEHCERKRIRRETGKPPADNMAPTGRMIVINSASSGSAG